MGDASSDTLRASRVAAFQAAEQALEEDGWRIELADPGAGEIETVWKPMHHFLLTLFAGKIEARCFVAVDSVDLERAAVIFRGGLASKHSLEGNVMLPFARRAYHDAARDWHREVREAVALGAGPADSVALRASSRGLDPPSAAEAAPAQ